MASTLMLRTGMMRTGFAAGAAMLALAASPAMAGRCGHSYPVDAPVTLVKVARACNVSLAALKEANPGVDPDYVTPGNHLAVPDETRSATDVPAGGVNVAAADEDYGYAQVYRYVEYNEPARTPSLKSASEASTVYASASSPYFIRASLNGELPSYRDDRNLSYQKLSAARIRHAGIPIGPESLAPLRQPAPNAYSVSATGDLPHQLYGEPLSPLMECSVLRRQADGKIKQVREFKPMPEGREAPPHCAAIEGASLDVADPQAVFSRSAYQALHPAEELVVMEGYVSAANAECVTVLTDNGALQVGVDLAPVELLGKYATIWAEASDAKRCGGLVMSSAVYAEPVR